MIRPGASAAGRRRHGARPCRPERACRSGAGMKVVSALRLSDGPWPADTDCLSHFAQVVVQLVIPPGQLVHLRLRDGQRHTGRHAKAGPSRPGVRGTHAPAHLAAASRRGRCVSSELVAGPAARADEQGRRSARSPRSPVLRRLPGERIDEDCRARRMAGHRRTVVEVRHLARSPSSTGHNPGRPRRASAGSGPRTHPRALASGSRPACRPTRRARPHRRPG